jgi:hypothetical protein
VLPDSGIVMLAEVALLGFVTGVTSKFSDLLNEHGVRWFPLASPLSGIVWGTCAVALTLTDQWVAAVWVATSLYWFLRCKLDHFNHAFAGVAVLSCGLYLASAGDFPLGVTMALFVWLTVSGLANSLAKQHWPEVSRLQTFARLRLRYYVGPVVVAAAEHTWLPAVAILAGMTGTEWITLWHRRFELRGQEVRLRWGMSYTPELRPDPTTPHIGRMVADAPSSGA